MMVRWVLALALGVTASAQVSYQDILEGPGKDWVTYAGSYNGWRHSPLKQITPENAGSMVAKWVYHVPKAQGLRATPIVYEGVMYVTSINSLYALDARTGRLIWSYFDPRAKKHGVNRGAAILGDRVYFSTTDNYLTALDRRTGGVLFSEQYASVDDGVTSTAAPLVVKDKVIVGSTGGDSGVRGFIAALSAETGELLWRTYTVPAKGEPGSETWGDLIDWGGGAAWLSGTFDPELDTLYWTTGNAWPDFNPRVRPGDNLYTSSAAGARSRDGQAEVAFPIHAPRHPRLGRPELAYFGRFALGRSRAKACPPRQP